MKPNEKAKTFQISNVPKWVWTVLKGFISIGLMLWLVFSFHWGDVLTSIKNVSWWTIPGFLLVILIAYCLMGLRLKILLSAQNIKISLFYSISLVFIGAFCGNFLPSSFGGDAFKFIYLARAGYSKAVSGSAVVIDRLLNILAVFVFLPFALKFAQYLNIDGQLFPDVDIRQMSVIISGGLLVLLFTILFLRKKDVSTISWLAPLRNIIQRLANILGEWAKHPLIILSASLLSLAIISLIFFGGWYIANGLEIEISLFDWFAVQACLSILTFIPISLNGFGLQEVSIVYFMSLMNISEENSLALALIMRVLLVSASLLGGIFMLSTRSQDESILDTAAYDG